MTTSPYWPVIIGTLGTLMTVLVFAILAYIYRNQDADDDGGW